MFTVLQTRHEVTTSTDFRDCHECEIGSDRFSPPSLRTTVRPTPHRPVHENHDQPVIDSAIWGVPVGSGLSEEGEGFSGDRLPRALCLSSRSGRKGRPGGLEERTRQALAKTLRHRRNRGAARIRRPRMRPIGTVRGDGNCCRRQSRTGVAGIPTSLGFRGLRDTRTPDSPDRSRGRSGRRPAGYPDTCTLRAAAAHPPPPPANRRRRTSPAGSVRRR